MLLILVSQDVPGRLMEGHFVQVILRKYPSLDGRCKFNGDNSLKVLEFGRTMQVQR